jgi:hypothetical protein
MVIVYLVMAIRKNLAKHKTIVSWILTIFHYEI